MKITQDFREHAAQKEIDEQAALGVGMKEKADEFVAAGAEIYGKACSGIDCRYESVSDLKSAPL
jgi:hypothetical protein